MHEAWAQGTASSKATADIKTLVRCNMSTQQIDDTVSLPTSCVNLFTGSGVAIDADGFVEIMNATVKLSNSQSLFVSPSLVTGLYTQTRTKTSTGSTSTAQAMGGVYLRSPYGCRRPGDRGSAAFRVQWRNSRLYSGCKRRVGCDAG